MTLENIRSIIIESIAEILELIIESNRTNLNNDKTVFHSISIPKITIRDYLKRLNRYSRCSIECFILALIYIDKLTKINIIFNEESSHRILFICLILAIKYLDDEIYTNKYYSEIGGLNLLEVNNLEKYTLELFKYNIHIKDKEYDIYLVEIQKIINKNLNN